MLSTDFMGSSPTPPPPPPPFPSSTSSPTVLAKYTKRPLELKNAEVIIMAFTFINLKIWIFLGRNGNTSVNIYICIFLQQRRKIDTFGKNDYNISIDYNIEQHELLA